MEVLNTPIKRKPALQQVQIPASPFMKKIGYGTGVAVYQMQRSPVYCKARSPWAVKKLLQKQKDNIELNKRIEDEAGILRKLKHPNIVAYKAFIKDSDGRNILAMEECSSCLGDMIEEQSSPYPAKTIMKVVKDISAALDYLHNEALLVHCDVKSYNILVKNDFVISKLCDFGVCLPVTKTGQLDVTKTDEEVEYAGTIAWFAPEVLKYPQVITTMADVYALGLVIWEMIALVPPVDETLANNFSSILDDSQGSEGRLDLSDVENLRTRPPLPDVELSKDYEAALEIFFCCTAIEMEKRPTAKDLRAILEELP